MSKGKRPASKKTQAKHGKSQTWIIMITTVVVLVLILAIVAIVFQNQKHSSDGAKGGGDGAIQYDHQPALGAKDAPVKVAEFGDYRCMYCRQFELDVFPKLKKDFIDTGKVRFYFMNYTILGTGSVLAADASEYIYAKHPEKFWDFHRLVYENQGPETEEWVTTDLLVKLAKQAVPDLDVNGFKWALDQGTYKDAIKKDIEMGKAAGVQGTPTVYINGKMASDPLDYNQLKEDIQNALEDAHD
jgi:protein-disulfide isomerase